MSGAAWTEAEKVHLSTITRPNPLPSHSLTLSQLSLVMSVLNDLGGTPNWKNVAYPIGRTLGGSQKVFAQLKKEAATVTMIGGNSGIPGSSPTVTPAKKRAKAAQTVPTDTDPLVSPVVKKRSRKPKNVLPEAGEEHEAHDSEEEDNASKKKLRTKQASVESEHGEDDETRD